MAESLGLLSGIAQGLNSGVNSYVQGKRYNEQKQRQDQQEARDAAHQQLMDRLTAKSSGYDIGVPEQQGGQIPLNETPEHADERKLKSTHNSYELSKYDENSPTSVAVRQRIITGLEGLKKGSSKDYLTGHETAAELEKDPVTKGLLSGEAGIARAGVLGNNTTLRLEGQDRRQQNQLDQRAHQNTVRQIQNDPNLKARLIQYQNLDNTLNNIVNSDHLTPEQINETQQAVRANLGIKGGSGVAERDADTIHSLGLNAERFKEFLTGSPADISKDNKLLSHIKNLAQLEQSNIRNQFKSQMDAASQGYGYLYDPNDEGYNPKFDRALKALVSAKMNQISPQTSAANQGLISQKSTQLTPEDQAAIDWAKNNPKDPRSSQILKLHGM